METSQTQLLRLLKKVSRSFYLSIRILPEQSRLPVSIAYLLARLADSIADSNSQENALKQNLLAEFLRYLGENHPEDLNRFIEQSLTQIDNPSESKLVSELPTILLQMQKMTKREQDLIIKVVSTLISGMQMDLRTFTQIKSITALPDQLALEEYMYRVAGCVGEFWTEILNMHYQQKLQWDSTKQIKCGINFGKALQLTNILRDVSKDAALGRCYIPATTLEKYELTADNFIANLNNQQSQAIIRRYVKLCLTYFQDAEAYLLATPCTQIRLRMAAFWPLAIGLKTLNLISRQSDNKPVKVKRRWVYQLLLISPIVLLSDRFTRNYLKQLHQQIVS